MESDLISLLTIVSLIILMTVVIQVLFISMAIQTLTRLGTWLVTPPFLLKTTSALIAVVLWLIAGISLSAWLWAGVFLFLEVFQDLEAALYFSIVTFTTLGYGDITLGPEWRILGSFAAVDGLIIFGLNTAFLVEFNSRLRAYQERAMTENKPENN